MTTLNDKHPELQAGEVFSCNTANPEMHGVQWKTKRLGKIAYDASGNVAEALYPVFRQISEADTLLDVLKLGATITFDDLIYLQGIPSEESIFWGIKGKPLDRCKLDDNGIKSTMKSIELYREDIQSRKRKES